MKNNNQRLWIVSTLLTAALELLTCLFRFGFRFESTLDTASTIGWLTCGVRIHHGYIGGVLMLAASLAWARWPRLSWWGLAVGLGLYFSDMMHHFVVLQLVVGSPEFDLFYPAQ
ncbi:MAG: hypothetical protein KDA81_16300 [Planctomycetaceae bacterium]|nr:hypothetical protein [Planctomycetaceae bacterium]